MSSAKERLTDYLTDVLGAEGCETAMAMFECVENEAAWAQQAHAVQSIIEQIDVELTKAPDTARAHLANIRTACLHMLPETNS